MEKIKYEFDPHSRLIATNIALRGIRKVLDGQFRISGSNTLAYHIKAPVPSGIKAPHQVKLKGAWSLTKDHQLRFTLDKWKRQTFGDQITFQGEIIDVQKNSLLFMVATKTKDNVPSKYILELSGSWQADDRNRLTFRVNKERGNPDSLVFDGAWQVDKNYRIAYSYQKAHLMRKSREVHALIFKGYWDIRDRARLAYVIDSNTGSGFDFNASMGIFKDDYIKYELGICLSRRKKPIKRAVTFWGRWKLCKTAGLVFEVKREGRKIQEIIFGAEANLTDRSNVLFRLKNSLDKKIGVELELSRDIFDGDGKAFLSLLKTKQESAILAGVGWRW